MLSLPENLNSTTWNELKDLGANDHTSIIMDSTNLLTKNNLDQQPQNKCSSIQRSTETFMKRYKELVEMALPSCWDKNRNFIQQEASEEILIKEMNDITKFQDMDGVLKGQTIVCKLINDFHLLWIIKILFPNIPSYDRYARLDIASRKMVKS